MTALSRPVAFTVDEGYDRDYAGADRSRFGGYLRLKASMFRDGGEMTTESTWFALAAWQIAQSPIMAPGYVRPHPRVLGTDEYWDDDQRPALTVLVAAPLPTAVQRGIEGRRWRGWEQHGYPEPRWYVPYDNDCLAVFTRVALRVPLTGAVLPAPRYRADIPDTATAKRAVRVICDLLNRELCPVLAALDN
jgi:hypothetical protein